MNAEQHRLRIWGIPAILALVTAFGLLSALLGTGIWHGLAWIALLIPIAVGLTCSFRSKGLDDKNKKAVAKP
ncbi:hypothetical protein [Pollutimonas bauzanensis]|uniref:Uncharacterized protein n=1 Tax=Pollutimonas bauzanensis TaxID=658167 RepID=A0A1M5W1W5_9BURK|nr:hypothetical protein [Pollutimonas bauzanensis]SHH81193.1 hypothetical protein SAMN04488135_10540 [Pollutimonas bauzanensis]